MQFRLKISVSAKGGNRPLLERVIDLPDSKSLVDFPFAKSIDVFNALFSSIDVIVDFNFEKL